MHEVLPPKNARNRPAYLRQRTHYLEFYQQRNAMVDLTEYARSLESDLPYVRGKIAMLETGTLQEGVRRPGKEWADISASTILLIRGLSGPVRRP